MFSKILKMLVEFEDCIESLPARNEKFRVAIDLLKRNENKLSVLNAHFTALFEVNPIRRCPASNLIKFVTEVKKSMTFWKN